MRVPSRSSHSFVVSCSDDAFVSARWRSSGDLQKNARAADAKRYSQSCPEDVACTEWRLFVCGGTGIGIFLFLKGRDKKGARL